MNEKSPVSSLQSRDPGLGTRDSHGKREYCGVFAIHSKVGHDVGFRIYNGLVSLQHRGQDSAGMAVSDGRKVKLKTGLGLVSDIFDRDSMADLSGHAGIGHVRYPTIGGCTEADAQPMLLHHPKKGIALAHNGNVANYSELAKEISGQGRMLGSGCDAEIILHLFASAYERTRDFFLSAKECMERIDGSYAVVAVTGEGELIAFRDPHGIKPLCFGEDKEKIIFASESVALDINEMQLKGFIEPGEVAVVGKKGIERKLMVKGKAPAHCMFEYVYFARPDSNLDGKLVYEVRMELGRRLARTAPIKADVVVPVPDTSRPAALGYSQESGIPLVEGLMKNRYVGRTFIMPSQKKRESAVALKLNAVRHLVEGKDIILIDDSIVRGTTSGPIVSMLKRAGAKKIHLRITCPPVISPCFYGIDLPTYSELIAANNSVEEIRKKVGADSLAYLNTEDLVSSIGLPGQLCLGCITDRYPTQTGMKLARKLKKEGGKLKGCRIWEEGAD